MSVWSDVSFVGGYKQRAKGSFYCRYIIYDYLYGPAKSIILFNHGKLSALSPILYYSLWCTENQSLFIMNSHHNKYVISLISEINCTNLVLLKWISSLHTYSRIHCKREHCKYIVCMNWKPVSLIRPARWLPLPAFLCHFAFDPFVTPIPPQPFVFIKKWWVSAQSELQRPLVGVKQTSSTRSTLHICLHKGQQTCSEALQVLWSFRWCSEKQNRRNSAESWLWMYTAGQQDEKIKVGELNTRTEGKTLFTTKETSTTYSLQNVYGI